MLRRRERRQRTTAMGLGRVITQTCCGVEHDGERVSDVALCEVRESPFGCSVEAESDDRFVRAVVAVGLGSGYLTAAYNRGFAQEQRLVGLNIRWVDFEAYGNSRHKRVLPRDCRVHLVEGWAPYTDRPSSLPPRVASGFWGVNRAEKIIRIPSGRPSVI